MMIIAIIALILLIIIYVCDSAEKDRLFKEIEDLKRDNQLVCSDFDNMSYDRYITEDSIEFINKSLKSNLDLLQKELVKSKIFSNNIKNIIKKMKDDTRNIDIVLIDTVEFCPDTYNLQNELKKMKNDFKEKDLIQLSISSTLNNNLYYDNERIISALKQIISKSFENGITDIFINVNAINEKNNVKVFFTIENIKFTKEEFISQLNDIYEFLSSKEYSLPIVETNIEPEFLIIRQNLFGIVENMTFKKKNNRIMMSFDMNCEIK